MDGDERGREAKNASFPKRLRSLERAARVIVRKPTSVFQTTESAGQMKLNEWMFHFFISRRTRDLNGVQTHIKQKQWLLALSRREGGGKGRRVGGITQAIVVVLLRSDCSHSQDPRYPFLSVGGRTEERELLGMCSGINSLCL